MQIGEQYGLAELQQLMVGRSQILSLAQEMPPEIHLQYHQQPQQQFHAAFQRHQIESHQQQNHHVARIYQAASSQHEENRQNHHSYHFHRQSSNPSSNTATNNGGIAHQLSLGSDSPPGAPSLSVSPPSKRTISPPGIVSRTQSVNVNGAATDPAPFEDYDEGFDEGDRSGGGGGGGGGNTRWPRQETLTLLKIRSEMDQKFREATHKGPLWDEVSRVLAEHGYQRSSKKCREKFENLYKYYKKTKEGKAGRQDGKHYRFFSQLEALYGGTTIDAADSCLRTNFTENSAGMDYNGDGGGGRASSQKFADTYNNSSPGFSWSSVSSSDEDDQYSHVKEEEEQLTSSRGKRKRKHWKSKIKTYFDSQMKKFMAKQEAWLHKVLETLEQREQERIRREETWRRQETARLDREHQLWSHERARAASCDAVFVTALQKLTGQSFQLPEIISPAAASGPINMNPDSSLSQDPQDILNSSYDPNNKRWPKPEILSLIRLRTSMEARFQEAGAKGPLWEEISASMSCLGYDRSAKRCKEKWENINKYFRKAKDSNRKRPENSKTCPYFQQLDSLYRQGALGFSNGGTSTMSNTTATTAIGTKATTHGQLDNQTADEVVFTSSHENDEVREAVETLGLMPSEDGITNEGNNDNNANHNSSNNNSSSNGPGAVAASNNCVQFFENGCNWEGYPMKLKMKQYQQQQHAVENNGGRHHHHQNTL